MNVVRRAINKMLHPEPARTGKVWNSWEHKGWGNAITIFDWDRCRLSGHLTPRPRVGDVVRLRMTSGRIGEVLLIDVDYMADPPDMWFATFKPLGYVEV